MAVAAERLAKAGADLVELELPAPFAELNKAHKRILYGEGRTAFLPLYLQHGDRLHDDFQHRVENRDGFTPAELAWAYDLAAECRKAFDALGFDAVITPSAPGEAPEGRIPGDPVFNQPWTLLHAPVVHVPVTKGAAGLPVGVSLVGPRLSDRRLLAVAASLAPYLEGA
jgi:Asp-tRNA(Asn)/Glu-tRNA(Gln) amidotransferase A subunit family amidase